MQLPLRKAKITDKPLGVQLTPLQIACMASITIYATPAYTNLNRTIVSEEAYSIANIYIYTYIYGEWICVYIYSYTVYICPYTYKYICIYIYIVFAGYTFYLNINIYIYIHIYIHMQNICIYTCTC